MKKKWVIRIFNIVGTLAIAGCSSLIPTEPDQKNDNCMHPSGEYSASASEWIEYSDYLMQLPPKDVSNERKKAQDAYAESSNDNNRIRLALAFGLAHKGFRNISRAQKLIQEIEQPALLDKPTQQLLGVFLSQLSAEQRAISEKYRLRKDTESHEQEKQELNEQIAILQEKIKALSDIERQISGKQLNGQ